MFSNYFKTALRNILRNPLYAFINVAGLAAGMTCMVLVVLFVKNELGYDNFHEYKSRLYRVTATVTDKEGIKNTYGATGQVQGPAFKEAIPEIENYVRFWNVGGFNIIGADKSLLQKGMFADSTFLTLFSFPLLYGNIHTALKDPFSVVITERTALKYFGKKDVVGQQLKMEEQGFQILTVTAVAKNPPLNSSLQFDVLIPFQLLEKFFKDDFWLNQYLSTFVLLRPGSDPLKVQEKFAAIFDAKAAQQIADPKKSDGFSAKIQYGLQPISGVHLDTASVANDSNITDAGGYKTLYVLLVIAVFILLMACINFVNLNLGHSLKRAKEIGIRKINGSSRAQIVMQFILETALLCVVAFVLALFLSKAFLPVFNSLTGRQLHFVLFNEKEIWLAWLGVIAISIIAAGLYPAMLVSRFKTTEVLYGKQTAGLRNWIGKSLIVLQFAMAIGLIIASVVYYVQMGFILKSDLGYNPAGVVKLQLPPQRDPDKLVKFFRDELAKDPSVLEVAGQNNWGTRNRVVVDGSEINVTKLRIDEHYLPALEIPLLDGRNFSPSFGADSIQSVLVNQSFVKAAGLPSPVGHNVKLIGEWEGDMPVNIVGVVKDFHQESFREKIAPAVFVMKHYENLFIKARPQKTLRVVATVERLYKSRLADSPLQISFLQDDITGQYDDERNWQRVINYATGIAILISCLGLFGMSWLAARQRTREIGIRKVLGSGVSGIVMLLSKDFIKLVLLSFLIACPVSWILMNRWLEGFAYRINISWWMLAIAGLLAMVIAFFALSFLSIKAAMANPVKSLRTE